MVLSMTKVVVMLVTMIVIVILTMTMARELIMLMTEIVGSHMIVVVWMKVVRMVSR